MKIPFRFKVSESWISTLISHCIQPEEYVWQNRHREEVELSIDSNEGTNKLKDR